ncbi:PQQ-binding-like beta-propeller repeat protein [Geodermatophilus sabuli]|uniref:Outer membrane protein assembly factor BamB, contains PQQ-like beta-propeller repeat n=1 Tax=Geodermatophilus sabuli TaxID=1564158 RepID=A0A285EH14_9ACTN|nr:PQQ-binding-like beta-propeller repeat protein [Geodermatophilus sabuli]SNX98409.1 Outer membrane protein assembly factor BamB, contains PQQ-like beta-propeller repeat [Geodermatophilus sabuli]
MWLWTAATLALVVVAALLWRGSDAAATESTTAGPAGVPPGTPAGAVSAAWTSATTTADGAARVSVHGGRVVVGDEHGVRALDAGTGEEAWRYHRANAVLCDWTLASGRVVAAFRTEDRCDEAVALVADTGVRAWTRNVDLRADMTLHGTDGIVLASSPTGVVTLDPVGDNTRWRQAPTEDCRLLDADVGAAGVVVVQRCADALQLRLFDGYAGSATWTRDLAGETATLAGVDRAVVVAEDDGVHLYAAADGTPLGAPVRDAAEGTVLAQGVGDAVLVLAGGTLTALDQETGEPRWETPATGLPTGAAAPGTAVPVADHGAVVVRDLATGTELGRSDVAGLRGGGLTTVIGPVVVLQLPDRVIAFR